MRSPVIKVEGLAVRYGDFWAVRDAHVKLEPGVIHAIIGENGAGKSTLLKTAASFVLWATGDVLVGCIFVLFACRVATPQARTAG